MSWELIKVEHTDWIQDNSGYYTLINWADAGIVRLDIMSTADDMPVVSFQGAASDVRKESARWIEQIMRNLHFAKVFSAEHAAYIGAELARAKLLGADYIQD